MPSQIQQRQQVVTATHNAYDAQIQAARGLFYPVAVDADVNLKDMPLASVYTNGGSRFLRNATDGDPVSIKTYYAQEAAGGRFDLHYVMVNAWGDPIPGAGAQNKTIILADGSSLSCYRIQADGSIVADGVNIRRAGKLTFKPMDGEGLATLQEEQARVNQALGLLNRLLDAFQQQDGGWSRIVK